MRCGRGGWARRDGADQVLLDRGVDGGLAAGDPLECFADFVGAGVFGEVSAGAGAQRVDDGAVIGVGGEHEHFDAGVMVAETAGGAGGCPLTWWPGSRPLPEGRVRHVPGRRATAPSLTCRIQGAAYPHTIALACMSLTVAAIVNSALSLMSGASSLPNTSPSHGQFRSVCDARNNYSSSPVSANQMSTPLPEPPLLA